MVAGLGRQLLRERRERRLDLVVEERRDGDDVVHVGPAQHLTDRGAYAALFGGAAYDPEAVAKAVVDAYDDAMEACLNDASSCYPSFAADAPTCSLDVGSDMPWPQISCTEDCVQDLFFAMDNGAYATCEDPVAAAMFLTPDLFKSCLGGGSQCSTCIDGCLADADADALAVSCATSGAKTKTKA